LERYPKAVTIRGADSTEARDANVKAFQNNPAVKIIICNIKAGGVGITLTASSRVAFVELPWHPADCEQCEDRCIAEGQLIMTTEGFKKVEDVKIGDFVYTGNGRFRPVLDAWNRLERKRAFVSIKYKGFSEPLIVTSDHEILIHDGNSTKYIPAGQLDILEHRLVFAAPTNGDIEAINIPLKFGNDFINHKGTTVKVNRIKNPLPELELTPNLMFGFGWYLAEGWSSLAKTREKGSFVAICGNAAKEKELVKQLAVMFKTVFNLDCKIHFSENGANCFSACLYSKNLASFFLEEFGNGSENKRIPQFVYNSKPGLKRAFLEGYYAGDGYRRKNTQQASTKSSTIATQLAQLEAGFGNPVTIRKTAWNGWSFEYSDPGKVSRQSLIKSESGMILFPIQEIKTFRPGKGKDRVYDLTVEGDESFVVGLATVHNCHRIGQKDSVQATYFLGKNTIDEDIFEMIEAKRTISETVTGSIDNIQTQIIDRLSEKLLKRTESHGAN
jgi:intein/homing endonuclease